MISIKKYIILTSIVLILSLICISSVSAANFDDDASSENLLKTNEETTITDNGKNDISLNGKQTENYGNKVTGPNVNNAENDMSFTDLEAAIEKAQAKGTNYTLTGNVIYDTDIDNPGAITIQQANMVIDGAGYTIDAKGMTGIFKITGTNVLLKNLKIINAKDDNGGALLIYGNNSKIIDCEFINCNAINEAGAIYSNGSNCNISYCNFTNCSSNNYTGAVFINGENSTIDSCNFENNTAYTSAGALGVGRVDNVKVRNCTFNNNYITIDTMEDGFGGAIYWNNNTGGIIENSTFTNNNAKFCAAAICWCGYDGVINNCNFIGNNVYENGGAIYLYLGTGNNITNSRFEDNRAKRGAGILTNGENTTIENCTFLNNNAFHEAGALYLNASNCNVKYCNFTNCSSDNYTGAVFVKSDNAIIDSCKFDNNSAGISAGALGVGLVDNVTVNNCTFTNNHVTEECGGAIYWNTNTGGYIVNSSFYNNSADHNGSAIYYDGIDGIIEDCTFIGNTVGENGGALYIAGKLNEIRTSIFENNTAKRGAGIIANGDETKITLCTFTNEHALHEAGAIYLNCTKGYIYQCTFTNCSSDNYTGAVFVKSDDGTVDSCIFNNNSAGISAGALGVGLVDYVTVNNCTFTNNHVTEQCGGAIYWNTNTGGIIANSTFLNNSADHNGSAIYYDGNNGTIKDCTFIGNTVGENGGALYIAGKLNEIRTSIFENNTAKRGAGIIANGDKTMIMFCNFTNEHALHEAGAIYLNCSYGFILQCTFTNCSSDNYTGAVFIKSDNGEVFNCIFDNNSAGISAGALGVGLVDNVTINNCTFTNNHVTEQCGGAIYWNTNTGGIIANSTFLNNSADHNGSAIYYDGNNGTIKDCTFIGNTVGENGGAIYIAGKNNIIYASNFMNNSAAYGSAIYTSSNLDVLNSSFENNNISKTDNVWVNIIQNPDKIQLIGKNVVYTINYDGTYTVTLKDLEGTPIVGKTIQFVLNGKNIGSATTNANGVATIKISANALKAAKAGTKNLKINFNQKIYAPITKTVKVTINKEKSKLTASSKKYNLRLKTKKYTVVLKNSKNKAIKNAKLTLKIKGKTYKASTNSQGKATFKINKLYKKGTFASVVKFAGNDYYKGVSKKVKIVIR